MPSCASIPVSRSTSATLRAPGSAAATRTPTGCCASTSPRAPTSPSTAPPTWTGSPTNSTTGPASASASPSRSKRSDPSCCVDRQDPPFVQKDPVRPGWSSRGCLGPPASTKACGRTSSSTVAPGAADGPHPGAPGFLDGPLGQAVRGAGETPARGPLGAARGPRARAEVRRRDALVAPECLGELGRLAGADAVGALPDGERPRREHLGRLLHAHAGQVITERRVADLRVGALELAP